MHEREPISIVDSLHRAAVSLSVAAHEHGLPFPLELPRTATNHKIVIHEGGSALALNSQNAGRSFGDLSALAIRASLFLVGQELKRLGK